MQTMHSVLKHGALYWDRDLLPAAAYERRYARLQAMVAASGDAGWFVYGDVARYGALTYVTNFLPRVRSALAFVPAAGAPVLFANIGKRDVPAAKTITWVDDVRPFGRLPGEVIGFVEGAKLSQGRIGHAGLDAIPIADWAAIAKGLPKVEWRPRDGELTALRAAKEDCEIAAITRAAAIADDALAPATKLIRPGVSLRRAIAGIDRAARAAGAEDVRYLVASGPQVATALRPVDDRALVAGDTVVIYAALEFQRYWAETARTFVLGRASDALRALHGQAADKLARMVAAARAGVQAGTVADAAGPGGAVYGLGHGIGLDAEEPPAIVAGSNDVLADGAALALRAILHGNGQGAAVAQTVVVGRDGARPINRAAPLMEIGA